MISRTEAAIAVLLVLPAIFAQSRPAFDAFEVASIKAVGPEVAGAGRWIRMQSANRFMAKNHGVKTLLAAAYNLNPRMISGGPAWIESERFDILAKTPGEVRPNLEEQMSMLRRLLAERFGVSFHREQKEFSIYALTVAKGGPKLKESTGSADATPEGPPPLVFVISPDGVKLPGRSATMGELASVMQRAAMDRPVVDRTGLAGRYDFDLEWAPDETQFGGMVPKAPPESTKVDLFAAIQQQLGLRLEATRGAVSVMVIDKVERPSEN